MFKYKINDGGVTITGIKDKSVISVIIPEFIDGYPVTNIGDLAFYYCISLTEISIPNSVTNICDNAFCGCTSLNDINIPNSVTNIGDGAFCYCSSLKEIIIPNSVTNIGKLAFHNSTSLKEINGIKLKEGVNLINNRFIYHKQSVFKIINQIGDDYSCNTDRYFIDNISYNKNFK